MDEVYILFSFLVGAGLVAGFLAGLLGIGGGVVTIPILYIVFQSLDFPTEWLMHIAVGTSLSIIIATNLSSVRAHHQRASVDVGLVKDLWWVLVAGTLVGSYFATYLKTDELIYFFAALAGVSAIKMMLPMEQWKLGLELPRGVRRFMIPSLIGFFSSILGIGGGVFSVPYLTLYNVPIQKAIGTSSLIGLVISIAGGAGYLVNGLSVEGLPDSNIGFVNIPAMLVVSVAAALMAPVGASVAHKLSRKLLSIIFGIFLVTAVYRMLSSL